MEKILFSLDDRAGKFKIMNATNGGPWHKRHASDQARSNFEAYKSARIPYSRNHDSGAVGIYGGPYSHDISKIFRDFNADENCPDSYDFACTDESILCSLEAGTETFFRLGECIEHQIKKHATIPPRDFGKWAIICEHIIRHYNEGWADGYQLGIKYWEIWNEPDLDSDDSKDKRTWGGTKTQFFDLYEITAKHLKSCFPSLKIGGPALAYNLEWAEDFLSQMQQRNVQIDFFSWHIYCTEPRQMIKRAERVKKLLIKYGYDRAESINNEWNYVKNWEEKFVYSIKVIKGMKGAAFVMACLSEAQKSPDIDMMMYYDTRPTSFCGAFDDRTYELLKTYYPLMWYGMFYDMEAEIRNKNSVDDIYTLCGVGKDENVLCVITHYSDDDSTKEKSLQVDFGRKGKYEIYLLDGDHNAELIKVCENIELIMNNHSCVLIKEI